MKEIKFIGQLDTKGPDEQGVFTGRASVFGVKDQGDDIVMPGSFTTSLKEHSDRKTMPVMLWSHDPAKTIGVYDAISEDSSALHVKGRLALGTQAGREAYELMKMGAISGLSIGYQTKRSEFDPKQKARLLHEVKLHEISLVSMPMNEEARVDYVKIARRHDVNPDEGMARYGDVMFADDMNHRYPIDTEEHVRAAWNYFHHPSNFDRYSAADQARIRDRIMAAWRRLIDPAGPPGKSVDDVEIKRFLEMEIRRLGWFSRAQAKALLSGGFKELLSLRDAEESEQDVQRDAAADSQGDVIAAIRRLSAAIRS